MELTCPRCSRMLPEVETLKYRFCPHCGAEIVADPDQHEDALRTIPPQFAPRPPRQRPKNSRLDTETGKKSTFTRGFSDQTIAPQPMASRPRPKIKPPDTPPPASFFRTPSETIKPPLQDINSQPPGKNRNTIIIAVLISMAVAILIVGGLLTF